MQLHSFDSQGIKVETKLGERLGRMSGFVIDEYRLANSIAVEKKLRRARRVAGVISLLPSVRLVSACNSVALGSARPESDIDLFIITSPGTIAITRGLILLGLAMFRMRPTNDRERDSICASFFITTNAMDMATLALPFDDPYMYVWMRTIVPLAERGDIYTKFADINNFTPIRPPSLFLLKRSDGFVAKLINNFLKLLEPTARIVQEKMFSSDIKKQMNKTTGVVVTNDVLKFHTNDRRLVFRSAWWLY